MHPQRYVITNTEVWTGDGQRFDGHVIVDGELIESIGVGPGPQDLPAIDLEGLALSPGMIDLMLLGGFNRSILRDDPREIAQEYLLRGVTACQLCMGSRPWETIEGIAGNVRRAQREPFEPSADIIGLYCEGPFQHPERTGASLSKFAQAPSPENVDRLLEVAGDVLTMVNVSPGTPGDTAAIRQLKTHGIVVSMAHSDAPATRVQACLDAGTTILGHIWDNNSGLLGDSRLQQPTLEHVALTNSQVKFIHLICDGQHVHPILIEILMRCRGVESVCLVTDGVRLAGCPDDTYLSDDGRTFEKRNGVGRTDTGDLCGCGLLLPDLLRNFINITGLPPHEAIRTVTHNPAQSIGLDEKIGILAPGHRADLVAWDPDMQVRRVWRGGLEIQGIHGEGEVLLQRTSPQ